MFMELRHLRYFVAAAEELHFHRAAERVGIKQPPLSAQIRQLEVELGTPLFHRLTRGVVLTEAGSALLEDARRILAAVETAKLEIARRVRGDTGRLNVGFASGTPFNPLLPKIVKAFRDTYPTVEISPMMSSSEELAHSVGDGATDVAFVFMPVSPVDGVRSVKIVRERWVLAVPSQHPLADRKSAPLSALAGETLIMVGRGMAPHVFEGVFALFERAGFTPRIGQPAPSVPSLIGMVVVGMGVAIVPQSLEHLRPPGVCYVAIEGEGEAEGPGSDVGLIWRRDTMPATVRNFIDVARRAAAEHAGQASPPINQDD